MRQPAFACPAFLAALLTRLAADAAPRAAANQTPPIRFDALLGFDKLPPAPKYLCCEPAAPPEILGKPLLPRGFSALDPEYSTSDTLLYKLKFSRRPE